MYMYASMPVAIIVIYNNIIIAIHTVNSTIETKFSHYPYNL